MAVTLQQIAERAGVSRGTVDRALNNRGRIRPEVAENIRKIAEEMGYRPNKAGKALALTNRSFRIGVIMQEIETPFIMSLLQGVTKAKEEVEELGGEVIVKEIRGVNTKAVIGAMEELREKQVQAIAINAAQNQKTREIINRFVNEYEIPVVTFNTDIEDCSRLCYIGQNAYQCGRAAAGLLGTVIHEEGPVIVISGYQTNPSLIRRCVGFRDEMQRLHPEFPVLDTRYAYNSDVIAETITRDILEQHRDLKGIFITAGVEEGVCAALEKENLLGKVKIVISDISPGVEKRLANDDISFAIVQNAHEQGHQAVMLLFELLFDNKYPEKKYYYTDLTILTSYNLPETL